MQVAISYLNALCSFIVRNCWPTNSHHLTDFLSFCWFALFRVAPSNAYYLTITIFAHYRVYIRSSSFEQCWIIWLMTRPMVRLWESQVKLSDGCSAFEVKEHDTSPSIQVCSQVESSRPLLTCLLHSTMAFFSNISFR